MTAPTLKLSDLTGPDAAGGRTVTTTRDALTRAVCANPPDDTARLVLADHYEENGEADLAACIRSQVVGGRSGFPVPEGKPAVFWHQGRTIEIQPAIPGIGYSVHGGFVAFVRCRLADWVGGPCENCEGEGTIESTRHENRREPCPDCGGGYEPRDEPDDLGYFPGTGRTPAHGPRIVAEQPVESLVITDCKPDPGSGDVWFFAEEWIAMMPDAVADEVDDLCWIESELAEAFLVRALLNWARREAGLPPLEERR